MMLQRCTDPTCPDCGCNESRVISQKPHWGKVLQRRQCTACGRVFRANAEKPADSCYAVTFHVVRCPLCQSEETKVTSTQRPVRYHKCEKCGHNFKSVEG